MRKILLSIVLLFAAISSVLAQKLTVEFFKLASSDLTAQTQPRKDLNNRNCALIKVELRLEGVLFEGNIMGNMENKIGEYWVYMPQGNRLLKIKHANYAPVMVTFADYGVEKLESGKTYKLTVSTFAQHANGNTSTLSLPVSQISIPVKDGISIEMVKVEAGKFSMEVTTEYDDVFDDNNSFYQVTLTNNYYIGKYEVTQALWQTVMGNNPSMFKGDNLPVEQVSWNDCQEFISKLSKMTDRKFRLPTEAEWAFAAQGGNQSKGYKYSGSNKVFEVAWYADNSEGRTHSVGSKQANELGIYDMSGNVEEWCQDWYDTHIGSSLTNPTGPTNGTKHVTRGGHWDLIAHNCNHSFRYHFSPECRRDFLGFRLALDE